jgi:Nif-specific regulatory protein
MQAQLDKQASLEALSAIAQTINTLHEPEELLEKVLETAMETLDAERGFVLLIDEEAREGFAVHSSRNFTEKQIGELVQISTSVVHEVMGSGEPVLVYEALHDERYRETESIVLQQIQSIACVPLRIKSRLIGAIYLDSLSRRGRFTRESLPFMTAFANQAAVAIENARLYKALREENRTLRAGVRRAHGFEGIIGQSPRMQDIFDLMARVAESDATVLLEGESGTGKELVARALHYTGDRKNKPFMALFCGSLPENLLESELFGHKKGAFTGAAMDKRGLFEAADGGTVFLDEVGDLSPSIQLALLRVLQEGEIKPVGDTQSRKVDVRIISATNKPLAQLVKDKEFREDLYYRLNTILITMPPLRARRSDIASLAHHFLDMYAKGRRSHIRGFMPEALKVIEAYGWPGNVRELQNTVERAVVLARGDLITPEDLRLTPDERRDPFEPGLPLKEIERRAVTQALEDNDNNISETARLLGVSRRWLHYKLKEWEAPES